MKHLIISIFTLSALLNTLYCQEKTRTIILADMGNEPDEIQQMVHMLVCSNEFELEGLIAVTGKYLRPGLKNKYKNFIHPELFHELIDAYALVYPNLVKHADGWPSVQYLRSIVSSGQTGYGIEDVGDGKTSEGAQLIIDALDKEDERPIWIVVNAGSNTLAQALYVLRKTRSTEELAKAIAKLRVFENGSQDNAGAWITSEFPEIYWIRSNYQTYAYGGPRRESENAGKELGPHLWKPFEYSPYGQAQWTAKHIQKRHGPLGKKYPDRTFGKGDRLRYAFMEGGGTIPWMGLVNQGLFDINEPNWGGWSGRFSKEKVANFWSRHDDIRVDEEEMAPFYTYREVGDVWLNPEDGITYRGDYVPVWRFRAAMYANLKARMDWCVKPFEKANHHPIAAINGDSSNTIIRLQAAPGEELSFDASGSSDPDGDELTYKWWIYEEAGTYSGNVMIHGSDTPKASLSLPTNLANKQIHLILEIQDKHPEVKLTDYRRIVIDGSAGG